MYTILSNSVGEPKLLTNLEVLETVNQQLDLLGVEFDGTEKTKTALGENNLLEYVWLLQRTKEYLRSSSTHLQDSESIAAFLADLKAFPIQFTKEEIFQLVNIVPTTQVTVYTVCLEYLFLISRLSKIALRG